ncbi:MAG TPA: nucleotide exchange factor GrpE [Anaerolineae bacterium]|nr:nucleotide exchange factor GrpE [Anaerolineae bacterium]HQK14165.1 nucleotide exchange factor GrpE [Anaerolineae bacterium]
MTTDEIREAWTVEEECVAENETTTPEPVTATVEETAAAPEAVEESATEAVSVEDELRDKIAQLEAQLAEAESKAAEYLDGLQRSQAAFANYRKRTEAEQVSWRSVANAALLTRLLPVLDDFERAFQALPAEFAGHAWLEGITLIRRKLAGILEAENVRPIQVQPGDTFDPLYHNALLHQEMPGFAEGQIIAEVERGYLLGERVLRPTSVVVAKAPAVAPAVEETAAGTVSEPGIIEAASPAETTTAPELETPPAVTDEAENTGNGSEAPGACTDAA